MRSCVSARRSSAYGSRKPSHRGWSEAVEVDFDHERERVRATEVISLDGIILERHTASVHDHVDPEEVARKLAQAASEDLARAFGADKDEVQLLDRIAFLRHWVPELSLPALGSLAPQEERGAAEREMIMQWCWGKRGFADLRRGSIASLIRQSISHEGWRAIETHAPSHITVPSGSHIRLDYSSPQLPPVLAVRIQEMFGCTETPRVANGKVALTLHLLAPNYRPAQVTQDLESFWTNTYPEVRRELRAALSQAFVARRPMGRQSGAQMSESFAR